MAVRRSIWLPEDPTHRIEWTIAQADVESLYWIQYYTMVAVADGGYD